MFDSSWATIPMRRQALEGSLSLLLRQSCGNECHQSRENMLMRLPDVRNVSIEIRGHQNQTRGVRASRKTNWETDRRGRGISDRPQVVRCLFMFMQFCRRSKRELFADRRHEILRMLITGRRTKKDAPRGLPVWTNGEEARRYWDKTACDLVRNENPVQQREAAELQVVRCAWHQGVSRVG